MPKSRAYRQCSRRRVGGVALLASVLLLSNGCSREPANSRTQPVQVAEQRDDSLALALELFQQSREPGQVRAALNAISGPLAKLAHKSAASYDAAARAHIQKQFGLTAAEMDDLEARTTRPLDAPYLDGCFLFRDAARGLEIGGLPRPDQLALGLAWTTRHILLHEQRDDGLPPHLVVQNGWGSARDRALVFCELARQWQLDSVLLTFPKDAGARLLVGVLVPSKDGDDLLLFDPRLGMPVAGPKGIASLAEVRAQPELLKVSGITPQQWRQTAARWASPAPGLAPRMKALEELLASQESVRLFHDVAGLERRLTALKLAASAWPDDDRGAPPGRLRRFYPKGEGGVDDGQRLIQSTLLKVMPAGVLAKYQQLKVLTDLGDAGQDMLTKNITATLVHKYAVEPRTALLRGRYEDALKRADRIGTILDHTDLAAPIPEEQFHQQIATWRERVIRAHVEGDEARTKQLWGEDQFIWALLQVDDAVSPQRHERKVLSQIVVRACRDPLGNQAEAIKAACWEEQAARLAAQAQERRRAGTDRARLRGDVDSAWKNARSGWAKYLYRGDVPRAQIARRLAAAAAWWREGQVALAIGLMEELHLDMHRALEARLRQAEANRRLGARESAQSALAALRHEVTAIQKLEEPRKLLQGCLDEVRGKPAAAIMVHRLDLLMRTWTPDGSLAVLHERLDRQLDAWKQ
ncbi:MAG: hypothetical protein L0Y71_04775 [Gemmataceae bacterium]|nr:hypothetical protein [Gemmataceae bacterium]